MRLPLKRMLGKTGVEISRLGLGGHTFLPNYGGMEQAEYFELLDIVNTAIAEGINLFDVTYDEERKLLGSLLNELYIRDKVFLSCWMSKQKTQTAVELKAEAKRALSLLGVEYVDLFYLDWTCTKEQVEAMVALREDGLTKFVGLLGLSVALENELTDLDVVLVNHNYHLRGNESGIRQLASSNPDIGIISLEPLGRGRFALDTDGKSMVSASLKYALSFEPVDTVLVAVRRLAHLLEDIEIWKSDFALTNIEQKALESSRGYGS